MLVGLLLLSLCLTEARHAACPADAISDLGEPVVACDRDPPCINWRWTTIATCSRLRLDSAWPTRDEVLSRDPLWHSARALFTDFLRDRSLLLVGDSLTNLVFYGLRCEAARLGLTVTDDNRAHSPGVSLQTFAVAETNSSVSQARLQHLGREPDVGKLPALLASADVVVVNNGLHVPDELEYQALLSTVLGDMAAYNRRFPLGERVALFRESSAQLFHGTGSWAGVNASFGAGGSPCAPLSPSVLATNRVSSFNAILHREAAALGLHVLPFFELSVNRSNQMEGFFRCPFLLRHKPEAVCNPDCTHMCLTPTLFARHVHDLYETLTVAGLSPSPAHDSHLV